MTEAWDGVTVQVEADWKDDTTPFERVYKVIEQPTTRSRQPWSPIGRL